MTRQELINRSEANIRRTLREHIPSQARIDLAEIRKMLHDERLIDGKVLS
jgi:hypothetical protein